MKKLIMSIIIVSTVAVSAMANDTTYNYQNTKQYQTISFSSEKWNKAILMSDDETSSETYAPKQKKSSKEIAGLVIGSVGAGGLGLNWFIYLVISLAAPPIVCSETGAILSERPLCFGIMATGWIPVIGPFIGGALTLSMIDEYLYYFRGCEELYAGIGVYCILTGLFEAAFLAMMIAGFAYYGYQKNKSKAAKLLNGKVFPIIGTAIDGDKTLNTLGVRIRI